MMNLHSLWSAKEKRLMGRNNQPYMRQWWDEAKGFQVVEPGKTAGGKVVTSTVNGIGKVVVGANTILDRTIDTFTNPQPPEPLRDDDMLPRAQRDARQLFKGIFSKDLFEHPVGTAIASTVRLINVGTSAAIDAVQKVGGGHNNTSNNYSTVA